MTYDQSLTLKPGDLICHNARLYWFDEDKDGVVHGKWDTCSTRNFLIVSIERSAKIDKTINAVRDCGGGEHDSQYTLLHEGEIIKVVLCPKNIQLL